MPACVPTQHRRNRRTSSNAYKRNRSNLQRAWYDDSGWKRHISCSDAVIHRPMRQSAAQLERNYSSRSRQEMRLHRKTAEMRASQMQPPSKALHDFADYRQAEPVTGGRLV